MSEYRDGERPSSRESPSSERLVTVEQKIENLIARDNGRHEDNTKKLDAILAQATLTNGRVTKLEAFRNMAVGAGIAFATVGSVVGFLFKILWDHAKP